MFDKMILLLSFLYYIKASTIWSPEDLSDYVKSNYLIINPNNTPYILIDPSNYTTETQKISLLSQMESLYINNKTTVTFIIIDEMTTSEQRDFVNQFNESYYSVDTSSYVTVFFAMTPHKSRVATGKTSRKIYSDEWCTNMLSKLATNLRQSEYFTAYTAALDYLIHPEKIKISYVGLIILLSVFGGAIIFAFIYGCCSKGSGDGSSSGYDSNSFGGGDCGGDCGGGGDGSW